MSTTQIRLVDVNTILWVPESVLPGVKDPTTDRLADHLASLYVEGMATCDSYDVGLTILGSNILGIPDIDRPSSSHERNDLRKHKTVGLTKRVANLEGEVKNLQGEVKNLQGEVKNLQGNASVFKLHFMNSLRDRKVALQRAHLIQEAETYDRILQGYNDMIFLQLGHDEVAMLKELGLSYITKLLDPPINLYQNEQEFVEYILGKLSDEERRAASALLPLLRQLKQGPAGRNSIQHPTPTIDEGVHYIEASHLDAGVKATLRTSLAFGLISTKGEELFLPSSDGETNLEILEREIRELEEAIAKL